MNKEHGKQLLKLVHPYRFRVIWTTLFLAAAILLLTIGIRKTAILAAFASVGYLIGKMQDNKMDMYSLLDFFRSIIRR